MRFRNLINGEWVESSSNDVYEAYNPANYTEKVAVTDRSLTQDADHAIASAKKASASWKNLSPVERGDCLHRAANQLEAQADEIATLATKEMGKRFAETKGEVMRGVTILRYYAQEGMRKLGDLLPSANANQTLLSMRVPLGVVGVISPWNFPIAIPVWKIAPALIYGNTIVWKPASNTAGTAAKIAEAFTEAGLPPGVLNLVNGSGSVIGNSIVEHPDVAAITFTGSNGVGKSIAERAVAHNKKYQLELGGKNPAVVLADADIELAAKLSLDGAMKQTGQRCTATSRVYVEGSVYEQFKATLLQYAEQIKVGDGFDSTVQMGPVASKSQYETVLHYIKLGNEEGAKLIYGGHPLKGADHEHGYYIEPTIFADVTNEMTIAREEIFGPVLCLIRVESYEEALVQANDTIYGLSASLFTNSLEKTFDFIRNSEVGMVQVNGETGGAEPQAPFGGMKESSSGTREQGQAAVEFFTAYKTVAINPAPKL